VYWGNCSQSKMPLLVLLPAHENSTTSHLCCAMCIGLWSVNELYSKRSVFVIWRLHIWVSRQLRSGTTSILRVARTKTSKDVLQIFVTAECSKSSNCVRTEWPQQGEVRRIYWSLGPPRQDLRRMRASRAEISFSLSTANSRSPYIADKASFIAWPAKIGAPSRVALSRERRRKPMNCGWGTSPGRDMTLLLMEFRDKPSEAPAVLIVATSAATEAMGPPIVKSSKKPNVRSLARERRNEWMARQRRGGPMSHPVERSLDAIVRCSYWRIEVWL